MTAVQRKFVLWLAQGFGSGRIPFAPGTFGSVVGLGWLALLLVAQNWWVLAIGIVASTALSVWLCDQGEKILNETDPGSIVMDEIIAIPLSFVSWLALALPVLPTPKQLFVDHWLAVIVIFALFRFFDIVKPWPVGRSQSLPGGLGVTVDDVLAGGYVNLVMLAFCYFTR